MINGNNLLGKPDTPLKKAKWNVLGDSISVNTTHATVFYHDIIKEKYGMSLVRNYGISGSKIADDGVTGDHMSMRFANMSDETDFVTVFGGTNDCGGSIPLGVMSDRTTNTFYGAMHVLLKGLIDKYPNKKIGFILPLQSSRLNRIDDLIHYVDVMEETCEYYSIPYLNLHKELGFTAHSSSQVSYYLPDDLHPNNDLQSRMADKIGFFMEKM